MFVFVCYFLVLILGLGYNFSRNFKEYLLLSSIGFCTFIVIITESLSFFHSINLTCIGVIWGIFFLVLLYLFFKKRKEILAGLNLKRKTIKTIFSSFRLYEKILVGILSLFIIVILFQGLIYPPNNWDSLTYHMSRIMYWIGNESIDYFPTHILRHLYQPPFAEYFILHVNLLNGNDYFSNSIQLFFLLLSILAIWTLLDSFKLSWFYKLLAAFLAITIPSVALQASTTKNDIVCSFFIISTVLFCIKSYRDYSFKNLLFLGFSVGLAFLTKGTAYLFLAPILLCFAVFTFLKLIKNPDLKIITNSFVALAIVIILNFGQYYRNYTLAGNLLNIDKAEAKMYSNDEMNGKLFLSNLLKNSGLHLGYPIGKKSDEIIRNIHLKMGVSIDNPKTNYNNSPYQGPVEVLSHEDSVPNLIPFILIVICFFNILFFSWKNFKKNKIAILLATIILMQAILFASYLKWQPWHTRLHIPMFLLSVILIVISTKNSKWYRYIVLASIPFLMYGFCFYTLFNRIRPLLKNKPYTVSIKIEDTRYQKYFSNQLHLYPEYFEIASKMYDDSPKKIGIALADWEYPILYNNYYNKTTVVAISVNNVTNKIPQDISNIDVLVVNYNTNFIEIEGKKFQNQTPNHKFLWYYK
jgi:hypothetical protein